MSRRKRRKVYSEHELHELHEFLYVDDNQNQLIIYIIIYLYS